MTQARMTTVLAATLVLCGVLAGQQPVQAAADKISWQHDLERALAQSAKDGRPVIAYFTFDT